MNTPKIILCCLAILFALPVDGSISKLERKYGKTKTESTGKTPSKNVKINKTKKQPPAIQKKESITVTPAPPKTETKPQPTYTEAEIADLKKKAKVYDVDALNKLVDVWDNDYSLIQEDETIKILQTAAAMGNSKAMVILSNCYRKGIVVKCNTEMATQYEKLAGKSGRKDSGEPLPGFSETSSTPQINHSSQETKPSIQAPTATPVSVTQVSIRQVHEYIEARTMGNIAVFETMFSDYVQYKYSDFKIVPRRDVLNDIQSGWERWVYRSYRLIDVGISGNEVEIIYSYDLKENNGKKTAKGYTKEIWNLDANGKINFWSETLSKKSAPSLSPEMKSIY